MENNLQQLQDFLDQNEIPKSKKRPKTFLGIAKQPHYENVLSNMYAFFFDENEVHKFRDLFTTSLMQLIERKTRNKELFQWHSKDFSLFQNFIPRTEVTTQKGGRIDLLLDNREQAIIIENKVYHHFDNDIHDYWNSISHNDDSKIGIILSLSYIEFTEHQHYINITHIELLQEVMHNLGNYIMDASEKYLVFLKDLNQNIINLSKPVMNIDDINFYFKNQQSINQLASFKFSLRDHIANEIEKAAFAYPQMSLNVPSSNSVHRKRLRYLTSHENPNLMITIVYEDLLNEKREFYIALELKWPLTNIKTKHEFEKFGVNFKGEDIIASDFKNNDRNWLHFMVEKYHYKDDMMLDFSQYLINCIKNDDFLYVFNKIDNYLTEKKNKG